jgi:uncharacterized UPF0146 family protein
LNTPFEGKSSRVLTNLGKTGNRQMQYEENAEIIEIATCGIYFLIDEGEVVYVGQSTNIHARIFQHIESVEKRFTHFASIPVDQDKLCKMELKMYEKYKPIYNRRPPNEQLKVLRANRVANSQNQAECIYSLYPLKVGKPAALRAIAKQLQKYPPAQILERTRMFSKLRNGNIKFVPHPATWFNQERFNDDPSTWMSGIENRNNGKAQSCL